jgi:triacylglycerol lipase
MATRRRCSTAALLALIAAACVRPQPSPPEPRPATSKRFPVLLLHGLTNKHPWGDDFLVACADAWGEKRVYLVYTNVRPRDRAAVSWRIVRGRRLVVGGTDNIAAGDESIATQAAHVQEIVARLQATAGLTERFSLIAHSMGGLVARRYIADHPNVVTGLVTLGTPHRGSPLATEFKWLGFFMGARAAIEDLKPERCARFNEQYPAATAPLAEGGGIFTIRGDADGTDAFGAAGELALGWSLLRSVQHVDSDGLVPEANALLPGATHLADFPDLDHYDLVRDAAVARCAAAALP